MEPLRVYPDTSVIGGCFDDEFAEDSLRLFKEAESGRIRFLISEIVNRELKGAPFEVRQILESLPVDAVETIEGLEEVTLLRNSYIHYGLLRPSQIDDAAHIASATLARADALVSWNFRHIVRLDKIKMYNNINLMHGFGVITILSPKEVVFDEPGEE